MAKLILLNAPKGSGKDVFAHTVCSVGKNTHHFKFTDELVTRVKQHYNISDDVWKEWYTTEGKELKRPELGGNSQREELISLSRNLKDMYGEDYFGEAALASVLESFDGLKHREHEYVAVFSDTGFNEEIPPLLRMFNPEDVYIVRITKDGVNTWSNECFKGDNRSWVGHPKIPDGNYITIHNDFTEDFIQVCLDTYEYILGK